MAKRIDRRPALFDFHGNPAVPSISVNAEKDVQPASDFASWI